MNKTEISLVDWQYNDCPVIFNGKVYDLCFIFDEGLVLKDDITGVHCFPYDIKIEESLKQVKHIAYRGQVQFLNTRELLNQLENNS